MPCTGLAGDLGLTRPSLAVLGALVVITFGYVATAELAKRLGNRAVGAAPP